MGPERKRPLRCAIYTRKSSEEGLEQAFNSLAAQREACAAFVHSQRHEGWRVLEAHYDDGGYSGGSLERPALIKALAQGRVWLNQLLHGETRSLGSMAKSARVSER
jgi:site-specific DNA recombinase